MTLPGAERNTDRVAGWGSRCTLLFRRCEERDAKDLNSEGTVVVADPLAVDPGFEQRDEGVAQQL